MTCELSGACEPCPSTPPNQRPLPRTWAERQSVTPSIGRSMHSVVSRGRGDALGCDFNRRSLLEASLRDGLDLVTLN